MLPVSPNSDRILVTRVGLIVPSNPAAAQASFTALALACGLSLRNSFTKPVLPWLRVAVAVGMNGSPRGKWPYQSPSKSQDKGDSNCRLTHTPARSADCRGIDGVTVHLLHR